MADDFSYNRLEPAWTYINPGSSLMLPVYEFDVQNQKQDHGTKLLREMPAGDWRLETHISRDNFDKERQYHGGLCVYRDSQNYLMFGSKSANYAGCYGVIGGRVLASTSSNESCLKGEYEYFAIEKHEHVYTFFASMDGQRWDTLPVTFKDVNASLDGGEIGLMNRYTGIPADVFHSENSVIRSWFVEYEYFAVNGQRISFPDAQQKDWTLLKSLGVFVMPVRNGATGENMPKLLRPQKERDWTLEGMLSYDSAMQNGDSLAGLALYADNRNYLIFGIRNGYGNSVHFELSGAIQGKPTGPLLELKLHRNDDRTLRITKRTQDGEFPTYYFYANENTYAGKFVDKTGVFDKAQYGAMAYEASGIEEAAYVVAFEHISEMIRDGYSDYFSNKTIDGIWNLESGKAQIGNSRMVLKSDAKDEAAILLRHEMIEDWMIDTTVTNIFNHAEAGLALSGEVERLLFTFDGNRLLLYSIAGGKPYFMDSGRAQIFVPEEKVNHLRIVKKEKSYSFRYSDDGLLWKAAFEYTDQSDAFKNGRYGLAAKNQGTFLQFQEGLRPTGVISDITKIEMVGAITGEDSMNKTQSRWGMGSTDLGSLFAFKGKIYGVYGDTFTGARGEGAWIHNAVSVGTVDHPADGIKFDQVFIGKDGRGSVLPPEEDYTCAMIPSCGFGVEKDGVDTLYMWVHEIYGWTVPGHRDVQGSGWAVSRDGGATWDYAGPMFDGNSPFQFVTAFAQKDMLYLFGNVGGGYGETYLMRVAAQDAMDKDAYSFYAGMDEYGAPVWAKDEKDAVWVLEQSNREIGIVYNEYLNVFLMTGLDTINDRIVIHESPSLFGPWSRAATLFNKMYMPVASVQDKPPHCYGAYSLPNMISGDGKTMYFTLSQFRPYQVHWLGVTFEKN